MSTKQEPEGEYVPGRFEDAVLLAMHALQNPERLATKGFPDAEAIAAHIQKAGALERSIDVDKVEAALIILQAHGFIEDAGDAP